MKLFLFLLAGAASAITWDFYVNCMDSPSAYTIDGLDNRGISVVAGDTLIFHFSANCVGNPMGIKRLDGTLYMGVVGTPTSLTVATTVDSPSCLIYFSTTYPTTMLGAITVVGGTPCIGTSPLFPLTLATPLVTPVATTPIVSVTTPVITLPATTTTVTLPTVTSCIAPTCPLLLACVGRATMHTPLVDGCAGCPVCVDMTLPCCPLIPLVGQICRDCTITYV